MLKLVVGEVKTIPLSLFLIPIFQEATIHNCILKEVLLEISPNLQEIHLCRSLFLIKLQPAHVFSSKFREIFKNTFFTEHLQTTASTDTTF